MMKPLLVLFSLLAISDAFAPAYKGSILQHSSAQSKQSCVDDPQRIKPSFPNFGSRNRYAFNLHATSSTAVEETARNLFDKSCKDGLMNLEEVKNVPFVSNLLKEGDLLESELVDIWSAIPKSNDKIDAEGFVTLYKDIDNLFEEEEDDASGDEGEEADLKEAFDLLAGASSTFSSAQLRKWEEITSLIDEEGMLGEDEFNELWKKSVGNSSGMDYTAFVKFNEALDDLFVLEDEEIEEVLAESGSNVEDEEVTVAEEAPKPASKPKPIITDTDLPPAVLFSQLADENYLVSQQDLLSRWGELRDMLSGGDLTQTELEELWNGVATAPGSTDKLDEEGFLILFDKIDELFEDEDEMEGNAGSEPNKITSVSKEPEMEDLKEELLELIQDLDRLSEEEGRQPCGLDCTELEQERVLEVVSDLEKEPYNRVSSVGGGSNVVPKEELVGNWDLIYSSSSTMKYNEGLSGLAGGLTRFGGVQQRLSATKYLSDVEYVEQVVGKVGGQSFEVRITGDWDLRTEVSLFTGKPSNVLSVTPDQVKYGPRSDKADHWKSLGPMNLLVLSYLDDDLRIMRGNTSTDTLFIFRRSKN